MKVICSAATLLLRSKSFTCQLRCTFLRILYTTGRCLGYIGFNFTSHELEGLVDVLALLGRGFEESYTVVVGHLLSLFERNCTLRFEICFVSHQNASDVVLRILFDLAHPCVHCIEGVPVSDVVGDDNTMSSLVITGSDCLEAFLTSCVPYLQLADFVVRVNCTDFKVNSDSWHEVFLKLIILNIRLVRFQPLRLSKLAQGPKYEKEPWRFHYHSGEKKFMISFERLIEVSTYSKSEEKAGLSYT